MDWGWNGRHFVLRAVCAGGAMLAISNCCSASEILIHAFHGGNSGAFPNGLVAIRENAKHDRFIGTAQEGGSGGGGTVFTIDQSGRMRILHSFSAGSQTGAYPLASVISDGAGGWYGTTEDGGASYFGSVFRIDQLGNYSIIYSFAGGTDGYYPDTSLVRDSTGNLYGTTPFGGAESSCQQSFAGCGTVFKVAPDGTETVIWTFQGGSDGAVPMSELIMDSSGNLYGTTSEGGGYTDQYYKYGCGTVFELTPQGQESILHAFKCGIDGADPEGGLLLDRRGNLFGTTYSEGCTQFCIQGTVFKLTPAGKETVLCTFSGDQGVSPRAALIADSDGNLYGTAWQGGAYGAGGVFEVTAGGAEIDLHDFKDGGSDGGYPASSLVLDRAGNLFGTTEQGGRVKKCRNMGSSCGTVFEFTAADLRAIRAKASKKSTVNTGIVPDG